MTCCIGKLIKKCNKIRDLWCIFQETTSRAKGEERAASADCNLEGFKHKIFTRQHRIVKEQPMFYYFKDKHRLSEVKLEFKGQNYMFNSYEMELYSEGSTITLKLSQGHQAFFKAGLLIYINSAIQWQKMKLDLDHVLGEQLQLALQFRNSYHCSFNFKSASQQVSQQENQQRKFSYSIVAPQTQKSLVKGERFI